MKVLKAIERGLVAAKQSSEPKKYQAVGKQIFCSHCGGENFEMPQGTVSMLPGFVLQCSQCSHLECFGKEPTANS